MSIEELYLYFGLFTLAIVTFIVGYLLDPIKRAKMIRTFTNRNYGVVVIRGKGGQTIYKVHDFNKPTCEYGKGENKKAYSIIEEAGDKVYVDHAGSVPIMYFAIDDTTPITLVAGSTKRILPENVESIIMLIKARSEAKAQMNLKTIKILLIICLALGAIGLLISFLTYNEVGGIKSLVMQVGNMTVPESQGFRLA
jgi:hypothetical protein